MFYAQTKGGAVIFGSELKSLMVHPGLTRSIDPTAIEDYFALGYIPEPKCIFEGGAQAHAGPYPGD